MLGVFVLIALRRSLFSVGVILSGDEAGLFWGDGVVVVDLDPERVLDALLVEVLAA